MKNFLIYLIGKPIFKSFNEKLFFLSLKGLGILNYRSGFLNGENHWLKNYLKVIDFPIIFDVGANEGDYTKTAIKNNNNAKIFCFEPHPKTYINLRNNLKDYIGKNIYPFNFGLGSSNGKLSLYDREDNEGSQHATLFEGVIKELHKTNSNSYKVDIIKLDDFISKNKIYK